MSDNHAELMVLGAGPGGYACAFRAADLGQNSVIVDPRATLGGVCLNEGCIPSKALLHVADVIREAHHAAKLGIDFGTPKIDLDTLRGQKDSTISNLTTGLKGIAKRRKVTHIRGIAKFTNTNSVDIDGVRWTFDKLVIAVGSRPAKLAGWPEDHRIWDSSDALELQSIPKNLAIVGGGIIGLEMATIYSALGSNVTIIELMDQIADGADKDATNILAKSLSSQGVTIHTSTKVSKVKPTKIKISLECKGEFTGTIQTNAVIQAVGRISNAPLLDPSTAGISIDNTGIIAVDASGRTNVSHIFAIGDVTGKPMLAHRATHQGHIAAEVIAGYRAALDTSLIPSVAYTSPEIAWVGLTHEQAKLSGVKHKVTNFPWAASGRNLASGGQDGLTKLIYCPETYRILGATLVGKNAGELLAECTLAIEMGATLEDIALSIHAHPTLSETVAFAAERALGTLTDL